MTYQPEHLQRWTRPDNYFGESWPEYFVFLGQHRDSDALSRSNFTCALKAIGGETETVHVIREGHWAVGWIEWIAIHQSDSKALETAEEIHCALADYPVVDDEHFSETEMEEANETWLHCYTVEERIDWIRKHRSQFEFRDLSDMLACVRGEYFAGYASELLT